jgi:hypothetical protein
MSTYKYENNYDNNIQIGYSYWNNKADNTSKYKKINIYV